MTISAEMIRELRSRTGLGLLECRNALVKMNGDLEAAIHELRAHSKQQVTDRGHRTAKEGVIASYVHQGNKIGVLLEVNCETDFVARNEEFRRFVSDLTLHIVAAAPKYIDRKDVDPNLVNEEQRIIEEGNEGKNPIAAGKILQGKMDKFYCSICLLEQPFVRNLDKTVQEVLNEIAAKFKENIVIRRFARFHLGQ
jgi:elongation factor Ts